MKNNWQTKKLSEVTDISAGNSAPQKKEYFENGKYPFIRTSDVGKIHIGRINRSADYVNDKAIRNMRLVKKGTLLFPKSGASTFLNHRVIMDIDGYVSSHLATIKSNDELLDEGFLFYYSILIDSRDLMQDQNYPSLRLLDIEQINISFPSINEQKRIVEKLNGIFEKIEKAKENTEKNLQKSRDLYNSFLSDVFTNGINEKKWQIDKLSKYNQVVVGYVGPISSEYTQGNEGVLLLSTKNIGKDGINLDKLTYINIKFHDRNKKSQLNSGDILVARHGYSGQAAVIPKDINQAHALNVIVIKKGEKIFSYYICLLLNSGVLDKIYSSKAGSVQKIINTSVIKELDIPVPTRSDQEKIVKKLDAISDQTKRLEENYKKKLEDLEELKKSILNEAFLGRL